MNSVVVSGRAATKPEISYTPQTQTACTWFSLAVDRPKRNGQDQGADFLRIKVWGRQAETCHQWLVKGQEAIVQGSIRISQGKDGKTYTEIVADKVEFGRKPSTNKATPEATNEQIGFAEVEDEPPF